MRGTRRCVVAGLVLGLCAAVAPARADQAASRNNEGNRLYEQKRYAEALKQYVDAQASRPGAAELHYNIGNVMYRRKEFDKAIEEYMRAQAAKDPTLAQAATFNRGNALMMQGKLQDAVQAYIQALRARPDDTDAKRNLELALRLLDEQKKKQQQNPSNKDQNQDPKQNPQPQGGGSSPQPQPRQKKPGEMTDDEARQVLEALRQEEKEGIKKHARAAAGDKKPPDEDW